VGYELLVNKETRTPPQDGRRLSAPPRGLVPSVLGALCAVAVVLWYVSLQQVDVDAIGDTGLVSVLPATFFVALALLSVSFFVCVRRRAGTGWHALHIGVLVLMLHGTVPSVYDVPRFAYVYKHLGVVDLVSRYGTVNRTIDAYNNWPGFFLLNALFRESAGLPNSLGYAAWAPVFFNLLWVVLLLTAYRRLVGDGATRWTAVWVFLCGSWVGQDYLAPQALGFALYLAIAGVAVAYLPVRAPRGRHTSRTRTWWRQLLARLPGAGREAQPPAHLPAHEWDGRSRLMVAVLIVMFAAVVASHQLSPLLILASVVIVVVVGRRRPWWLPLVLALMVVAWFGGVAGDFLLANTGLVGDVGQRPDEAISENLSDLQMSPGQVQVALVSRALSATVWLLALVGFLVRWRAGHRDRDFIIVALALVPATFVVAVSYGGEMLFRVYLFSLPWVSLLAGAALASLATADFTGWAARVFRTVVTPLLLLALACALVVAGYGLEKVNHIRADEVSASTWFYDNVPDASLMMLLVGNFPSRLEGNYGRFQVNNLFVEEPRYRNHTFSEADVPRLVRILEAYTRYSMEVRDVPEADAYFVLSSSQTDFADLYRLATPEEMASLEAVLAASPLFEIVYAGPDARIYRLQKVVEP